MYGNFTAPPTRSPEASSAPLNLFRNRERYHLECYDTTSTLGFTGLRADAWTKTLYAKDRLLEDPIPSYLIHDNLMQSHFLSQSRNMIKDPREISLPAFRHSTLSACHHEHRSLYVHAGGKGMDELILRDVRYVPQYVGGELLSEPGFTLPLCRGSPILSVAVAGLCASNSSSNILARTSSEVYSLRTVNVTDSIPIYHRYPAPKNELSEYHGTEIILEPLQKWSCPDELVAMATSSSQWSYASFLTAKGHLYNWNPMGGLTLHSSVPVLTGLADLSQGCYSLQKVKAGLLECTLHPQELLTALGDRVYRIDLRVKPLTVVHTANNYISSLKQHGTEQNLFILGMSDGGVSLMDSRYAKNSIAKRAIPEAHSDVRFIDISDHRNLNQGVFMGSSCYSRQIYMHTIESAGRTHFESDIFMGSAGSVADGSKKSMLLAASSVFGTKSAVRWDVSAYPVVERSTNQTLWGFDFVPVRDADLEPEFSPDDLECDGVGDPHTAISASTAGYIMQQSSLGDVYAQLVTFVGQDKELCCESSADPDPRSAPITSPVAVAASVKKKGKVTRDSSNSSSSDDSDDVKPRAPLSAAIPVARVAFKIPSRNDSSSGSSESDSESDSGAAGAVKSSAAVVAASRDIKPESSSGSSSETDSSSDSDSDSDPKVPPVVPATAIASGMKGKDSVDDSSDSSGEESAPKPLPFLPPPPPFEPLSDRGSSDGSESDSESVGSKGTSTHTTQPSDRVSGRKRSAEKENATSAAPKKSKINVQLGGACGVVHLNRPLRIRKHDSAHHYEQKKKDDRMYGHTFQTLNDHMHFDKWLKYHTLEMPVCDRVFLPKEDPGVVRYPADSSSFVPFLEEESLKGMDMIRILPEEVRKDYVMAKLGKVLLTRVERGVLSDLDVVRQIFNAKVPIFTIQPNNANLAVNRPQQITVLLNRIARSGGMTLWEIWTHLNRIVPGNHMVNVQVLRQYVLELDGVCEKILPLGDLPVPLGDHKVLSSTQTFDGAYVVPFAHHPVDGKSRFQVNKNYAILRDETEMKFTKGILKGDVVEDCTCINERGELVKSGPVSRQIPCDHPCCLAPYRLMYQMKDTKFTGHVEGSSSNSSSSSSSSATAATADGDGDGVDRPALGASWSGYNDVSPQLLQVLANTWKDG